MPNSYEKEIPNFPDDIRKILILSFESYRKSLLFAGYKENMFDNWALARKFAKSHNMWPIHDTDGGKYLNVPDRDKDLKYSAGQIRQVWNRASIKYCVNIQGTVKTLVCGAGMDSTFRRKEIPAMLRSRTIEKINGQDHAEYVRLRRAVLARLKEDRDLPDQSRHKLCINAVFRKMALAEIRQDLLIAREQGNLSEERAVLDRVSHLRWRHKEELRAVPRSRELQQLNESYAAQEEMARANPRLGAVLSGRHLGL